MTLPHQTQRIRLDPTITLGASIQIAVLLFTALIWLLRGDATSTQTAKDVVLLQAAVVRQAADTRTEIKEAMGRVEAGLVAVQQQIATLPDMTARVRQLEIDARRLEARHAEADQRSETRRMVVDGKLDELRRMTIEATAAVDSLRRASAVNLPGARGVR